MPAKRKTASKIQDLNPRKNPKSGKSPSDIPITKVVDKAESRPALEGLLPVLIQ
jgi:hypothetical protein